jgi:hypothetical protein
MDWDRELRRISKNPKTQEAAEQLRRENDCKDQETVRQWHREVMLALEEDAPAMLEMLGVKTL